jgi:malate dehydrogenase (oxaloacetate-decarboxylating)
MIVPEILLVQSRHRAGSLASILKVLGDAGLVVENISAVSRDQDMTVWEITVEIDEEDSRRVYEAINALPNARILGTSDRVFNRHRGGKIETRSRITINSHQVLRDIYTPGVARVCLAIEREPGLVWDYTARGNTVAIVTNATAVLGLGRLRPEASLPVMEGKAALFATFAGVSAVPVVLAEAYDEEAIVATVARLAPSFGAIQLEDIAAPTCFAVEEALRARLEIPILHDDQEGTAVVVLAALTTVTRRLGRPLEDLRIGHLGLGAAGYGIARLVKVAGARTLYGADIDARVCARFAALGGTVLGLEELLERADVVIATTGRKGLIPPERIRPGQIVFALSNPEPEITPHTALAHGAAVATDGRSMNNLLAFPGLFRGILDLRARRFDDAHLLAAARALTELTPEKDITPDPLDPKVHEAVAAAVRAVGVRNAGGR